MNRRNFLTNSGLMIGGGFLAGSLPFETLLASENKDHFFVQITLTDGWDITLATDPWLPEQRPEVKDMFIEYSPSELLKGEEIFMGPAMNPLLEYAAQMTIVNGILAGKSDNGHEAHRRYMTTGVGNSARPEIAVQIAECSQDAGALGVLTLNGRPFLGSSKQMVTDIGSLNGVGGSNGVDLEIPRANTPVSRAQELLKKQALKLQEMQTLSAQLKTTLKSIIPESNFTLGMIPSVIAGFQTGLARTATMSLRPQGQGLDTHSAHEGVHKNALTGLMGDIATILKAFKEIPFGNKGESFYDRTTFYITSDFSRTPALNTSGGKDHNPLTNSVILIGRGLKGGRTVGASRLVTREQSSLGMPYHIAGGFDHGTQQVVTERTATTTVILPENVIASVEKLFGVPKSWSGIQMKGYKALSI